MSVRKQRFHSRQHMETGDYEIFLRSDSNDLFVAMHYHDFYECLLILDGQISVQIEDSIFQARPGDLFMYGPNQLHKTAYVTSKAPYERYLLWVSGAYLSSLSTPQSELKGCFNYKKYNVYHFSGEDFLKISDLFSNLANLSEDDGRFGTDILKTTYISEFFVFLNEYCLKYSDSSFPANRRKIDLVESVNHYIEDHIEEKITLDELAGHVYMSRFHFSRLFKEITGTTVHQYIIQRRLMKARDLILSGVLLTEAYSKCGFSDYSCFFRAFKLDYGVSPREYYNNFAGK